MTCAGGISNVGPAHVLLFTNGRECVTKAREKARAPGLRLALSHSSGQDALWTLVTFIHVDEWV